MAPPETDLILVTGAHGYIGSHVVTALLKRGYKVVATDIVAPCPHPPHPSLEVVIGNLCDRNFCIRVTEGVHTIMHFAANMGGMGVIHKDNGIEIYQDNQAMALHLLHAAKQFNVKRFLFASSACVYPEDLQSSLSSESGIKLKETDAWPDAEPPRPQALYGLEKLVTELILHQLPGITLRIARFHNIYGPGGAWCNGREKAPAAFLRKALALRKLSQIEGCGPLEMEIWGDGKQRRSFLFIDDCVNGILRLLEHAPDTNTPLTVNIGSDSDVTIQELATIALHAVDKTLSDSVKFQYLLDKPVGVASRNSDNDFVSLEIDWNPSTSLEEGLLATVPWMDQQMEQRLEKEDRETLLRAFSHSKVVNLKEERIHYALILPITSRGGSVQGQCLEYLRKFAQSLYSTTWRDTNQLGGTRYRYTVYLVIDHDDHFLLDPSNHPEQVLKSENVVDVKTIIATVPRGEVCSLWRIVAKQAWEHDRCDYYVLLGDDVTLKDEGWMRHVHAEFASLTETTGAPFGLGCVAFTDISFPGMPTFPIVHRLHLDIFHGEVVPRAFVNQDGDPFLFQLYRRWGCSRLFSSRIENAVGGRKEARYEKKRTTDWTFGTLTKAVEGVQRGLAERSLSASKVLTLDVIIPSYRVQIDLLSGILELKSSSTCSVMFIIIIDDPHSPATFELEHKYAHRADVRIRVNKKNLGASASRNRGMQESAAEWMYCLDDDVVPNQDVLFQAEKVIQDHPRAAGFVGNTRFPPPVNMFTTAIHQAGVLYFWDIATKTNVIKANDVPWGVTANLITRRDVDDGVFFDLEYPKTGGGEDIAFCREKRDASIARGGQALVAAPDVIVTHPYWNEGKRSYFRFVWWAYGDGLLIRKSLSLTYMDYAPNSAELLMVFLIILVIGLPLSCLCSKANVVRIASQGLMATILSNIIHDLYRHASREQDRLASLRAASSLSSLGWTAAIIESSFVRMASEGGRLLGLLQRGDLRLLLRRFDWFAGTAGDGPKREERWNNVQRLSLTLVVLSHMLLFW